MYTKNADTKRIREKGLDHLRNPTTAQTNDACINTCMINPISTRCIIRMKSE